MLQKAERGALENGGKVLAMNTLLTSITLAIQRAKRPIFQIWNTAGRSLSKDGQYHAQTAVTLLKEDCFSLTWWHL